MEEAYSPRRDRLEDRRARDRTNRARTRRHSPTPIRTDEPDEAA